MRDVRHTFPFEPSDERSFYLTFELTFTASFSLCSSVSFGFPGVSASLRPFVMVMVMDLFVFAFAVKLRGSTESVDWRKS